MVYRCYGLDRYEYYILLHDMILTGARVDGAPEGRDGQVRSVAVGPVAHGVEALAGVLGVDPFLDEVGVGEVGQGRPDAPL